MADETVTPRVLAMSQDRAEKLQVLTMKLTAMLNHTFGNSGEAFRDMDEGRQDSYMWACAEMMEEVHELALELAPVEVA